MLKRIALAAVVAAVLASPGPVHAEEKFLGKLIRLEMAAKDAKIATATLQDEGGRTVIISVEDKVTLDKLADKARQPGRQGQGPLRRQGGQERRHLFQEAGRLLAARSRLGVDEPEPPAHT